jgi:Protein of unknown function (DUF2809)
MAQENCYTSILNMANFNFRYLSVTILLFLIEVGIAILFTDSFIRPFVGDVLVVILIYCFIRTFWRIRPTRLALSVFVFACVVEALQYFNFVDRAGLRPYPLLVIIIGTRFDWRDILAYAAGTAIILGWEHHRKTQRLNLDRT